MKIIVLGMICCNIEALRSPHKVYGGMHMGSSIWGGSMGLWLDYLY
jgi:hypothetical protein